MSSALLDKFSKYRNNNGKLNYFDIPDSELSSIENNRIKFDIYFEYTYNKCVYADGRSIYIDEYSEQDSDVQCEIDEFLAKDILKNEENYSEFRKLSVSNVDDTNSPVIITLKGELFVTIKEFDRIWNLLELYQNDNFNVYVQDMEEI